MTSLPERACDATENGLSRAIGLFGLYAMFYSQPAGEIAPKLWTVEHVGIEIGVCIRTGHGADRR
jgi:hypothetical protein